MNARVYVAESATRGVKIGYSADPPVRMKQVSVASRGPVTLRHQSVELADAKAVEAMAHWLLREHHAGAEWFDVTPCEGTAAVAEAMCRVAAGETAPRRINNATPYADLKDVRIQLVMSPSEIAALDEWRAEHKVWSRSDAIRKLIAEGIKRRARKSP